MDNVRLTQLTCKQRPVGQLGSDGAEVLDLDGPSKRKRRQRVDRNEPRVNVGIVAPGPQEPRGLNGLPAENPHRWGNDRNVEASDRHR